MAQKSESDLAAGSLNWSTFFLFCGILFFATYAIAFIIFGIFYDDIFVSVGSIIVNAALTAALIFVYLQLVTEQRQQRIEIARQADLQEKVIDQQQIQSEVLNKQHQLMKLEYRPIIHIRGSKITSEGIELDLENIGRGIAINIAVRCSLKIKEPRFTNTAVSNGADDAYLYNPDAVFYIDENNTKYFPTIENATRRMGKEIFSMRSRGGVLSPEDDVIEFHAPLRFGKTYEGGVARISPTEVFQHLSERGITKIEFHIDLLYCDESGNIDVVQIVGKSGNLREDLTLSGIHRFGDDISGGREVVKKHLEDNPRYPNPTFDLREGD